MEKSDRIPGKFLKLLYIVVEKAAKNNWSIIDKEQVNLTWQDDAEQSTITQIESPINDKELAKTKVSLWLWHQF